MKNTKKALFLSLLAIVLCFSMLIGSTFAWFTDTATTGVNTIQAGKLDIDLVDKDGKTLVGSDLQFVSATATDGMVDPADVLWEPGATYELEPVTLVNLGNLAAKYQIALTLGNEEKSEAGASLAEVIDVIINGQTMGALKDILAANGGIFNEGTLMPAGDETGADEATYGTVQLHMQETAGNEYQKLTLKTLALTVYATQLSYENDSFDDQYDADANYATKVPTDLNDGGSHTVDLSDTDYIVTGADISETLSAIRVQGNSTAVIKGNGTVEVTAEQGVSNAMAVWARNGAKIVIEDGTFILNRAEGNYNEVEMIYASGNGSTITIKGGTFKCDHPSKTLNIHDNSAAYIYIQGGSFWEFDPSVHEDVGKVVVPVGYKVVSEVKADGTWYTVVPE